MIELIRVETSPEGIFGVLLVNGRIVGLTREKSSAALPVGKYVCRRCEIPFRGETFAAVIDSGFKEIPFHPASVADAEGILVGPSIDVLRFESRIFSEDSRKIFRRFMDALTGWEQAPLLISCRKHGVEND